MWGESHDYANHVSSLNGTQAVVTTTGITATSSPTGTPALPNWLDTTGLPVGFMTMRWTLSHTERTASDRGGAQSPVRRGRRHLPSSTPRVSAEQRRDQIRIRQNTSNAATGSIERSTMTDTLTRDDMKGFWADWLGGQPGGRARR